MRKIKVTELFLWCLFVLIIIPIAGIIAMCIIDPELLLFEGDYEVLWILQLLLMMGVCSVYYFKFIVNETYDKIVKEANENKTK